MQSQHENSPFRGNYTIQMQGELMSFERPKIMGIINLTPDSFFEASRSQSQKEVLNQAELMIKDGADILDLGAFSSRPGAALINQETEKERLLPGLQAIRKEFPDAILSVDTYRSEIAGMAIGEGAQIINDISGGKFDEKMFQTIAKLQVPYILMHMQGKPENMQDNPSYDNVFNEVFAFFKKSIDQLNLLGVNDIILDPGFGFGKTLSHNYQLLKQSQLFHALNCPVLIGISRKGMIQKVINEAAEEALNGTTVAHTIALMNGANLLRVHDVREARQAIEIVDYYQKQ